MKKFLLIGLIVGLVLIVIGGVGVVFAQVREVDTAASVTVNIAQNGDEIQQFGYGPGGQVGGNIIRIGPRSGGMMDEYGNSYGPGGMMGGYDNGYGPGGMMGGYGNGYGPGGMMGERGNGRGGMMGGRGIANGEGVMHDYMISAFASVVGLTVDEVNTRLTNGETLKAIALAQGKTIADLPGLWSQVRQAALDKVVANGIITQAQADLMLLHMKNYSGPGFGPDKCPMMDDDEVQQP
jgi:hypothetical protein